MGFSIVFCKKKFENGAICLAEFADGDAVRVMLACGHGFHAHCIRAGSRLAAARPARRATPAAVAAAAQPDEAARPVRRAARQPLLPLPRRLMGPLVLPDVLRAGPVAAAVQPDVAAASSS
ncbi:RING-H2 finger protein ATL5-like [Miscanthus floridulus]|uniref:RING-H2 finger protein ATL5-like n=1 Tax=Miscanthus floridulus TaxID=154761 RepID=UPI003458D903